MTSMTNARVVTDGCGVDRVDGLADASQGRVAADGGIGPGQIVVDGADEADNVEVSEGFNLLLGQFALSIELLEQAGPLVAEPVGTGEGAVTAADDEGVDALDDHVLCRCQAAVSLVERHAPRCADEGAALGEAARTSCQCISLIMSPPLTSPS